ncbi:MAG: hypothetical protein JG773_527 [Spirochaeta sp.]|jgi:hypothetical protein|nr:hypothetical protein [Spirochaeta sp.]
MNFWYRERIINEMAEYMLGISLCIDDAPHLDENNTFRTS